MTAPRPCTRTLVLQKLSGAGPRRRRYPVPASFPFLKRVRIKGGLYEVIADVHDYRPAAVSVLPTEATQR